MNLRSLRPCSHLAQYAGSFLNLRVGISASLALGALCLGWSHHTYSQSAVVEISNTPAVNSQELPIQNGERLSDWMLKERQIQNTKSSWYHNPLHW